MAEWLVLFSDPHKDTSPESCDLLLCIERVPRAPKVYIPCIWTGLNLASLSRASVLPCCTCHVFSPEG